MERASVVSNGYLQQYAQKVSYRDRKVGRG